MHRFLVQLNQIGRTNISRWSLDRLLIIYDGTELFLEEAVLSVHLGISSLIGRILRSLNRDGVSCFHSYGLIDETTFFLDRASSKD